MAHRYIVTLPAEIRVHVESDSEQDAQSLATVQADMYFERGFFIPQDMAYVIRTDDARLVEIDEDCMCEECESERS
jgi:hypothetical protein